MAGAVVMYGGIMMTQEMIPWKLTYSVTDSPERTEAEKAVYDFKGWVITWLTVVINSFELKQSVLEKYIVSYIMKVAELRQNHGGHLTSDDPIPSFGESVCYVQLSSDRDCDGIIVLVFKFTPEGTFTFAKFMFNFRYLQSITNCLDTAVLDEFQLIAEEELRKTYKMPMRHIGNKELVEFVFDNNQNLKTNLDGSLKA